MVAFARIQGGVPVQGRQEKERMAFLLPLGCLWFILP
jgi:hypothetical protein